MKLVYFLTCLAALTIFAFSSFSQELRMMQGPPKGPMESVGRSQTI